MSGVFGLCVSMYCRSREISTKNSVVRFVVLRGVLMVNEIVYRHLAICRVAK